MTLWDYNSHTDLDESISFWHGAEEALKCYSKELGEAYDQIDDEWNYYAELRFIIGEILYSEGNITLGVNQFCMILEGSF